jgi:hypothetical protein
MPMSESEKFSESPSVLIIAYRRAKNVAKILDLCERAIIRNIYVIVDVPKGNSPEAWRDHNMVLEVIKSFEKSSGISVKKKVADSNQGCALTVLLGCDWALTTSKSLIVIEDDCIPSLAFFLFCNSQLPLLESNEDLWIVCGTQFAPSKVVGESPCYSKFALTWGWATTQEKWKEMRESFVKPASFLKFKEFFTFSPEKVFWKAGARRALEGYTDVWDTILVDSLKSKKKFALLPPVNLVSNLGNDQVSTHVESNSSWTNLVAHNPGSFLSPSFRINRQLDKWLQRNFYKIRLRHSITTKCTLINDVLFSKKRKKFTSPLKERFSSALPC